MAAGGDRPEVATFARETVADLLQEALPWANAQVDFGQVVREQFCVGVGVGVGVGVRVRVRVGVGVGVGVGVWCLVLVLVFGVRLPRTLPVTGQRR